jgi:hypothetical protein
MKTKKTLIIISLTLFCSFYALSIDRGYEKFHGFMIDAPRTVETVEYYFRLIDFCKGEKINSIIFRLTDDQGSAFLFKSHPELKMCEGAFTAAELKKLVNYAQKQGIEMIPEIESFGHSRYITQSKRYKFLNDGPEGADFNAVCPVSDSTLKLMKDLYAEAGTVFNSQYFHIGCDEVNWGAGEMSKAALSVKSRPQIWAEYINNLNRLLKAIGRKTIIWGDVPIYREKEVLDLLDKDIVLMDWNYWETDTSKIDGVADLILNKGFKLIGCPAINWCRWGPRIGELQLKNINAYAEVYGKLNNPNNLGLILSNWVPARYLQNSQWDTYTIAIEIMNNNGNFYYLNAIPAFIKNHFGARYDANWGKIYRILYEKIPQWNCGQNDSLKFSPWYSERHIKDIILKNKQLKNNFSEIKSLLSLYRDSVTRNIDDFSALLLTVDFVEFNFNRQNDLLNFAKSGKTDLKAVEAYLNKVAGEDQKQLAMINSAWIRGRRTKPDEKDENYMWSFCLASNYSKYLSENPSEFIKILRGNNL